MKPAERHEPPRELEAKVLRSLQRSACIAELCPSVTHKLNNALAGTLSNLELVAMDKELPPEIKESHQWSKDAAWQAANLNRLFADFLTRQDPFEGLVEVDGLLFQTVQFLRKFSDRRVDIVHEPASGRINTTANPAMLTELVMALAMLGQRLLTNGGAIKFAASHEGNGALVTMVLAPASTQHTPPEPEAAPLLNWLVYSLAQSLGVTLETARKGREIERFQLHLPAAI